MNPNPLRLILAGYAGAAALGAVATAGWPAFLAALWLGGPVCVLALATVPPFARAFARERETPMEDGDETGFDRAAHRWAGPRRLPERELAAWDADAEADRAAARGRESGSADTAGGRGA